LNVFAFCQQLFFRFFFQLQLAGFYDEVVSENKVSNEGKEGETDSGADPSVGPHKEVQNL